MHTDNSLLKTLNAKGYKTPRPHFKVQSRNSSGKQRQQNRQLGYLARIPRIESLCCDPHANLFGLTTAACALRFTPVLPKTWSSLTTTSSVIHNARDSFTFSISYNEHAGFKRRNKYNSNSCHESVTTYSQHALKAEPADGTITGQGIARSSHDYRWKRDTFP